MGVTQGWDKSLYCLAGAGVVVLATAVAGTVWLLMTHFGKTAIVGLLAAFVAVGLNVIIAASVLLILMFEFQALQVAGPLVFGFIAALLANLFIFLKFE